jgi:hypothetical protein
VNVLGYPDAWKPYVTFKNATIAVVILFIVTNAMWYAQGRPIVVARQGIPWIWSATFFMRSPTFILADLVAVAIGFVVVYRVRTRASHYQAAVTIYGMLLANLIGVLRTCSFLRTGL